MIFFPDEKTFLSIFGLTIQWYAVLILCGAFVAYLIAKHNLKAVKYIDRNDFLSDFFIYVLWVGIIGARLWFCIFNDFKFYFSDPINILKIYDGGLAIHGGLICGILFALWFCKRKNVSFLKVADSVFPGVLVAQAIGRWGNFVNRECHGPMVDASYFDGILSFIKDGMYINGHYYVPTFLYESLLCLLGFVIIEFIVRKFQNKRGDLMWAYMMWYGVVRFYIETMRTDALMAGSFKIAQVTSVCLVAIGLLGYLGFFERFIKKRKPTILFDLDGTLVDTEGCILASYRAMFKKYDKEENFTREKELEVLGPPIDVKLHEFFPNENVEDLVKEYRALNTEMVGKHAKLMPNADVVLKTLKEEGYHIGIVSTKVKEGVEFALKTFGLDTYVDDVVGQNDVINNKPDPECIYKIIANNHFNADDVVVIGDSYSDVEAGKNYGAYTIGYLFNEERAKKLIDSNPNKLVSDLKEILDILRNERYFTYNGR